MLFEMRSFHTKHLQPRNHKTMHFILQILGYMPLGDWTLALWAFQFSLHILSLPSLQSMALLNSDFPCLPQNTDSSFSNLGPWIVLKLQRWPFHPDRVSELEFVTLYVCLISFMHSSIGTQGSWFYVLALVIHTSVTMRVQISDVLPVLSHMCKHVLIYICTHSGRTAGL